MVQETLEVTGPEIYEDLVKNLLYMLKSHKNSNAQNHRFIRENRTNAALQITFPTNLGCQTVKAYKASMAPHDHRVALLPNNHADGINQAERFAYRTDKR